MWHSTLFAVCLLQHIQVLLMPVCYFISRLLNFLKKNLSVKNKIIKYCSNLFSFIYKRIKQYLNVRKFIM